MKHLPQKILDWHAVHGRHDLPWQREPSGYGVWVSEVMLQQTQVGTVIPYYRRFMARFPTVGDLAAADLDQVLHLWSGLGYYARARNLHRAAREITAHYGGELPRDVDALAALPGIGRSTAGAIAVFSMGLSAPVLDGNVKRVLSRAFAIGGYPEHSRTKAALWGLAEALLQEVPEGRVADYTQGLMDLGSLVCTRGSPRCGGCPLRRGCRAFAADAVADYPGRKPRRELPVRAVTLFIVQDERGAVLLERRPPNGVWGGLYSFPESLPPTVKTIGGRTVLPAMRHTFSHYHLDIQPVRMRAERDTNQIADSDRWLWYPLDYSVEVGLAAPVKKLLTSMAAESGPPTGSTTGLRPCFADSPSRGE